MGFVKQSYPAHGAKSRGEKAARRYKSDEEILARLNTDLQAVVDVTVAEIKILIERV
jgi:hypothetical protein